MDHELVLKPGKEKSILRHHPWVFSGAIAKVVGSPEQGSLVDIFDSRHQWLAKAGYNPFSQIAARIWTWTETEGIRQDYFDRVIQQAYHLREPLERYTNAFRIVNAENDGLPGVVIDRYDEFLVMQFLSASAEYFRKNIIHSMRQFDAIRGIFERSDSEFRTKENLPRSVGPLMGVEPNEKILIFEGDRKYYVDIQKGHKTGFYLDQRDSRKAVSHLISQYASGKEILNVFSYTGAFAVCAYASGARHVVNIDSSQYFLSLTDDHYALNGIPEEKKENIAGNAFEILRTFRDSGRQFDMVILDPPKLLQTKKDLRRAARAYKDINWLAMRILRPGGWLVTFSCSGLLSEELFVKILFAASVDASREVQILHRMGQPLDHPYRLSFPEGKYLKGFICRVL
jgi:23S rRNA (cytosine1962-C5)-methyltransferase